MSPICYGLVILGSIAIALAVYTFIMTGWGTFRRWFSHPSITTPSGKISFGPLILHPYLASTSKYRKGIDNTDATTSVAECAVCLSGFEEGECVRQLQSCNHSFHAPCIDMWLFSHFDCPLCRTPVDRVDSTSGALTPQQNSQEVMLDIGISA